MQKIDYKKEFKHLYKPTAKRVDFVYVPEMQFLMVDGQGDPNTSKDYQEAIEALYSVSYAVKFMVKKGEMQIDYGVLPLECLWWADDMSSFATGKKDDWKWTAMIMQPAIVTPTHVEMAFRDVKRKKDIAALDKVRFENFEEGDAAQILHIGPFSEEGPTIELVHAAIEEAGHTRRGKHHEIYLSDIRKAAPEKWRTVIRQPFTK